MTEFRMKGTWSWRAQRPGNPRKIEKRKDPHGGEDPSYILVGDARGLLVDDNVKIISSPAAGRMACSDCGWSLPESAAWKVIWAPWNRRDTSPSNDRDGDGWARVEKRGAKSRLNMDPGIKCHARWAREKLRECWLGGNTRVWWTERNKGEMKERNRKKKEGKKRGRFDTNIVYSYVHKDEEYFEK